MWKVKELEELAKTKVGDGKKPNLFFVSVKGKIVTVTRNFVVAYEQWRTLSDSKAEETALEDRQTGVLASVQPCEDNSSRLEMLDDTHYFKFR